MRMEDINGIKVSVKRGDSESSSSEEISSAAFVAQNVQGVVINEILSDPSGSTTNFDTDGDGMFETNDEFVELFNTSGVDVDISGWTLTDGGGDTFIFPTGTIIPAGEHLVIVGGWSPGTPPDHILVEGSDFGLFNNGDNITLSDGMTSAVASYGGDSTAGAEDFGAIGDGVSITRSPDGSMTFDNVATPTPQCFLAHTRIMTSKGYKRIETLKVGDQVRTNDGKLERIKWVSIQTIDIHKPANPLRRNPVRFKKGSLGLDLPVLPY